MMDKKNQKQPDEMKNFRFHHYFLKHHYIFPAKNRLINTRDAIQQIIMLKIRCHLLIKHYSLIKDVTYFKSFTWLRATHFRNKMKQNKSDISNVNEINE